MRLVIDTFKLVKGAGKSIGIYNVAMTLVKYLGKDNKNNGFPNDIIVIGNEYNRKDMDVDGITFYLQEGDPLSRMDAVKWELFGVNDVAKKFKADRIFFPRGYRPLFCSVKDTVLIHDLIPFFYDEEFKGYFGRLENAYIMNRLKASIRGADRVITISNFSKKDIVKRTKVSPKKIRRIYNGINDMPSSAMGLAKDEKKYIAASTSHLPHKNATGLLRAYDAYFKKCKEHGIEPMPMYLIGIDAEFFDDCINLDIISKEAANMVTCTKYFEKFEDMCKIIARARCYMFLSYIEGFGFPPLEAMQLGTPVICSNKSSLPEVVGDAAILTEIDDYDYIAKALLNLDKDDGLCKKLIARGYENVKRFTWDSKLREYKSELLRK